MGVDLQALDGAAGDAGAPQPDGEAVGAGNAAVEGDGEGHGEGAGEAGAPQPEGQAVGAGDPAVQGGGEGHGEGVQEAGEAAAGGDAVGVGVPADEGALPKGVHLRKAVKAVAAANRKLWIADLRAKNPDMYYKDAALEILRRAREAVHKLPLAGQWELVHSYVPKDRKELWHAELNVLKRLLASLALPCPPPHYLAPPPHYLAPPPYLARVFAHAPVYLCFGLWATEGAPRSKRNIPEQLCQRGIQPRGRSSGFQPRGRSSGVQPRGRSSGVQPRGRTGG